MPRSYNGTASSSPGALGKCVINGLERQAWEGEARKWRLELAQAPESKLSDFPNVQRRDVECLTARISSDTGLLPACCPRLFLNPLLPLPAVPVTHWAALLECK